MLCVLRMLDGMKASIIFLINLVSSAYMGVAVAVFFFGDYPQAIGAAMISCALRLFIIDLRMMGREEN